MYVQSDTLSLADVFENFRKTYLKVYELDPAQFLSACGLAWQACLKKTGVKLEFLIDVDMLLMVENHIKSNSLSNHIFLKKFNSQFQEIKA